MTASTPAPAAQSAPTVAERNAAGHARLEQELADLVARFPGMAQRPTSGHAALVAVAVPGEDGRPFGVLGLSFSHLPPEVTPAVVRRAAGPAIANKRMLGIAFISSMPRRSRSYVSASRRGPASSYR